jgi:hypothetical protein
MHTHRRQFVRDGEVPVTVIHHDEGGTNKLESARHALRAQIEAREQAEQQLAEARATVQALETQLAHERIAKEETLGRAEVQRQELEDQLEEERTARQRAEQERDRAVLGRQEAEKQLRAMAKKAQTPSSGPRRTRKPVNAAGDRGSDCRAADRDTVPVEVSSAVGKQRGRPPKARDASSEFVEWWKPGWQDQCR